VVYGIVGVAGLMKLVSCLYAAPAARKTRVNVEVDFFARPKGHLFIKGFYDNNKPGRIDYFWVDRLCRFYLWKKNFRLEAMLLGVALMVFPYMIQGTLWLYLTGILFNSGSLYFQGDF